MEMAKIVSFGRLSNSEVVFNENYIPPVKESSMKYYASHNRFDFKGFWEAPLAVIQSDTDRHIFNVYLIPEVAYLIDNHYKEAESFHGETVALFVKQKKFSIKKIGEIEIIQNAQKEWIAKHSGIPAEYEDISLNCILEAGLELGIDIQTQAIPTSIAI